jgi:hypothetical protein
MPRKILNICRRCLCRIIKCSTVVHSNISKCSVYFIVDKNVKNGNKILNLNLFYCVNRKANKPVIVGGGKDYNFLNGGHTVLMVRNLGDFPKRTFADIF